MTETEKKHLGLGGEPGVMLSAGGVVMVLVVTTIAMAFGILLALRLGSTLNTPEVVRVRLGSDGFTPETVQIQSGRPVEIWVFRKDAVPCTGSVVLENLGIIKALAPRKATMVAFTPKHQGDYTLRCGMGCRKAILKVRDEEVVVLPVFFE